MLYFEIYQILCAFIFLFGSMWSTWIDVNVDRGLMQSFSGTRQSRFVARSAEIQRFSDGANVADGN